MVAAMSADATILACALLVLPMLAGCGPVPVAQAERDCLERARMAAHPRGTLRMGASSRGGMHSRLNLDISSDWLAGRDPAAVYDSCVVARSGQMPRRPLYDMPEWKG